jgi:hypothetical protein
MGISITGADESRPLALNAATSPAATKSITTCLPARRPRSLLVFAAAKHDPSVSQQHILASWKVKLHT